MSAVHEGSENGRTTRTSGDPQGAAAMTNSHGVPRGETSTLPTKALFSLYN